jgi:hypothetical protein
MGQLQTLSEQAKMAPLRRKLTQAETQKTTAGIPLTEAQAAYSREQAKFLPLQTALKAQQQSQSASRFGAAYQLARTIQAMPSAQRAAWVAEHPQQWEAIQQSLIGQAIGGGQSPEQSVVSSLMQKTFPDAFTKGVQPGQAPQGPPLPESLIPGGAGLPPGQAPAQPQAGPPGMIQPQVAQQPIASPSGEAQQTPDSLIPSVPGAGGAGPIPQQVSLDDQYRMAANKSMVSGQINKMAENAVSLDRWLYGNRNEYKKRINSVLQYAGVVGKGKRAEEEWLNKNPEALSNYDWFKKTFTTTLTNRIKLMEGVGATDNQRDELRALVGEIDNIKSSPLRAKKALNKLFGTMQDVSKVAIDTAEPAHKGTYNRMYGLTPFKGSYLDDDKPSGSQEAAGGVIRMRTPDGKMWSVPEGRVSEALKMGASRTQ